MSTCSRFSCGIVCQSMGNFIFSASTCTICGVVFVVFFVVIFCFFIMMWFGFFFYLTKICFSSLVSKSFCC